MNRITCLKVIHFLFFYFYLFIFYLATNGVMSYSRWASNQPSNQTNHDCAQQVGAVDDFYESDITCNTCLPYVCVKRKYWLHLCWLSWNFFVVFKQALLDHNIKVHIILAFKRQLWVRLLQLFRWFFNI